MRTIVRPVLACLPAVVLACATGSQPPAVEPGAAPPGAAAVTLCSGPGSYGIPDFPCPSATVQGWVSNRDGSRTRTHAWYLFAGLHQPTTGGQPLWRTWPTSTQVFPEQFGVEADGGRMHGELLHLPGALLERPVPGTPRFAGSDVTVDPGVDAKDLALPGAPDYEVPQEILRDPRYGTCLRKNARGTPFLIDGPTFQSNGDVMVAGVIYSPRAADSILRARLWDAAVLDGGLPPSSTGITHATMPNDSVVLKPQLWPVRGDGFTPLPRWDVANTPDADKIVVRSGGLSTECEIYSGFERQELWKGAVALSALQVGPQPATADASYLGTVGLKDGFDIRCQPQRTQRVPITYRNVPVVPLSRFYTFRYTPAQLDAMNVCDRALLDQSALWSYNRRFEARDALVLIAMHIMTKEQSSWTFQSAWWDPAAQSCAGSSANDCRYAGDRPSSIGSDDVWRNYFMTTTYGITQQPTGTHANRWPRGSTATNHWPVAFNPFIELAAGHPIETNCINCHRRAAWPSRITPSRRFPNRNSAYLVTGQNVPGLLDTFTPNEPVLGGLLTLDSMWAISDRAYYPSRQEEGAEAEGSEE